MDFSIVIYFVLMLLIVILFIIFVFVFSDDSNFDLEDSSDITQAKLRD